MRNEKPQAREREDEFDERTVFINRCSKVVKGGRRFSFSAVIVVGDKAGRVGYGFGKANEVPDAIRKGSEMARKDVFNVVMNERTIPHDVTGSHGGARVLLRAASPGTGIIAGGGMRSVLEVSGIRDVLGKSLGSKNKLNVVRATVDALQQLRSRDEIAAVRNVAV